jgi:hypothetical protein
MVTRKSFLVQLGSGTCLLVLGGCGGGGSSYSASNSPAAGGGCSASTITDNHGHALAIPAADLNSTVAMTYSIQGSADHSHDVTFSAAQLAQLKAGQMVTVGTTTTLAHAHTVTEACV